MEDGWADDDAPAPGPPSTKMTLVEDGSNAGAMGRRGGEAKRGEGGVIVVVGREEAPVDVGARREVDSPDSGGASALAPPPEKNVLSLERNGISFTSPRSLCSERLWRRGCEDRRPA